MYAEHWVWGQLGNTREHVSRGTIGWWGTQICVHPLEIDRPRESLTSQRNYITHTPCAHEQEQQQQQQQKEQLLGVRNGGISGNNTCIWLNPGRKFICHTPKTESWPPKLLELQNCITYTPRAARQTTWQLQVSQSHTPAHLQRLCRH